MKNNVDEKFLEYCHPYWDVLLCLVDELLNTTFPFFARENSDDICGEREVHMQTY